MGTRARLGAAQGEHALPDLSVLEALYEAHHRQALGVAYAVLRDAVEAEDVVQDALLAAWRAWPEYDPAKGTTRRWVMAMVRNRCIDVLRARRRAPTVSLDTALERTDGQDVSAQALTHLVGSAARQVLATLPASQRRVVELAYLGGLSHAEIAEQLALPLGTVKSRIRLALGRLRAGLGVREPAAA